MKKKKMWRILFILLKILLAVPLIGVFILIRGIQFFLKLCGPVVSFVCIVSAVMVSIGAVGMAMVILEAVCSWIWKFYMGNSDSLKAFYRRPDYKWSTFSEEDRNGEGRDSEVRLHYFKGVKNLEELKKRYRALLRIYRPVKGFGEDEITRGIVKEYHYLKEKFLEENKNIS